MIVVNTKELDKNLLEKNMKEYEELIRKQKEPNLDETIQLAISTRIMFLQQDITELAKRFVS